MSTAVGRRMKPGRTVQVDHVRITVMGTDGKEVQLLIDGARTVDVLPVSEKPEPTTKHRRVG